MRKYICLLVLAMSSVYGVIAQDRVDTNAVIKELNQVFSFSVQPYLHYSSVLRVYMDPIIDKSASERTLHSEFYKVQDDMYYGNEDEEVYLQDSLMIRINHARKTIQLGKVDVATKKGVDVLPLNSKSMQKMIREQCIVSEEKAGGDTMHINVRSREKRMPQGMTSSNILVTYHKRTHLPMSMEMSMRVSNDGASMSQTASISFGEIQMMAEKAMQMPVWRAQVDYDSDSGNYIGKGRCEGYEVIKTF